MVPQPGQGVVGQFMLSYMKKIIIETGLNRSGE